MSTSSSLCLSKLLFILLLCASVASTTSIPLDCDISVNIPRLSLTNIAFDVYVKLPPYHGNMMWISQVPYNITLVKKDTKPVLLYSANITTKDSSDLPITGSSTASLLLKSSGSHTLSVHVLGCKPKLVKAHILVAWLSILPPLLTIFCAVFLKQVLISLLLGVWLAALFVYEYNPVVAVERTLDTYIVNAIASADHAAILLFTYLLAALIGGVSKSGGAAGLAQMVVRFTSTPRKALIACFCLCLLIFFDDYSSLLIVGNSMRSVMQEANVSSEKFAFIVHSMGPCLASFSPISSWAGMELGFIQSSFESIGRSDMSSFMIFINSIPYRVFPVMLPLFILMISLTRRDFGPMLSAERKALCKHTRSLNIADDDVEDYGSISCSTSIVDEGDDLMDDLTGPLTPEKSTPKRWANAMIPFITVIVITIIGMYLSGRKVIKNMPPDIRVKMTAVNIFTYSETMNALVWSCFVGLIVSATMFLIQRILSFSKIMASWIEGMKDVVEPLCVLILAWALGDAVVDVGTGPFLASIIKSSNLPAEYIPPLVVVAGYVLSSATGSSIGSMALLFPIVVPLVYNLSDTPELYHSAVGAIFGSTIFGNTFVPIADCTIITCMACRCDLNEHVKTVTPYIMTVAFVALVLVHLPVAAGLNVFAAWAIALASLLGILYAFGTPVKGTGSFSSRTSMAIKTLGIRCKLSCRRKCCSITSEEDGL